MNRSRFAMLALLVALLGIASALVEVPNSMRGEDQVAGPKVGRPVRVVSLSFADRPVDQIANLVEQEAARGADLIVLPETWTGRDPVELDGPVMKRFCDIAREHKVYILNPVYRQVADGAQNSAVLIDRSGKIAGAYDKAFPYWSEFDAVRDLGVGSDAPVFETDFGRLGCAICFDVNFPEVWSRLADNGAELVIWPSAYSAGRALQAHALNHHYYIVTSTWKNDVQVYDITGERLMDTFDADINVTRVELDLDRRIFHTNFNTDKVEKLLSERADDVEKQQELEREQWFVLKARRPGVNVQSLAREYGLEELRDYVVRSRAEMDRRREFGFADAFLPHGTPDGKKELTDKAAAN